jgi:hypothetical protein
MKNKEVVDAARLWKEWDTFALAVPSYFFLYSGTLTLLRGAALGRAIRDPWLVAGEIPHETE